MNIDTIYKDLMQEIGELKKDLANVREMQARIQEQIKSQTTLCSIHQNAMEKLDHQVNGNGKPGHEDRIASLEKFEVRVITYAGFSSILGAVASWIISTFYFLH